MLTKKLFHTCLLILLTIFGCQRNESPYADATNEKSILFFNMTSDPEEDPHAVTMGLQLAGHGLDDGRHVVLFFNVHAVGIPTKDFPADLAFSDKPIKTLLTELIDAGAEVHVCPMCMKALNVDPQNLLAGAEVTDRIKLFANLASNTNVFTY